MMIINGVQILTKTGYKSIEDINVGDFVYTNRGFVQIVNDVSGRLKNEIKNTESKFNCHVGRSMSIKETINLVR